MKDAWRSCRMWQSVDTRPQPLYKDVVIIGNGPSAISLSHMLAGNWPYYHGTHPLEFLHYRLDNEPRLSLVEQDLESLCEGLEGRSNNPVPLLFDTLFHPEADLGLKLSPCLRWQHQPEMEIDHVVLGRGPVGGMWQKLEGNTLTISLNSWMELPCSPYEEWEHASPSKQSRATANSLAQYYSHYVKHRNLDGYFRNYCVVTNVRRTDSDCCCCNDCCECSPQWEVRGYSALEGSSFCYLTPSLVLATGSYDSPNVLRVPGEDLPFVLHSVPRMEQLIGSRHLSSDMDPLVVMGAGLSAADAIIFARFHGIPVVHVFRRDVDDPSMVFNRLPENMYPEYHKVYQMMHGGSGYTGYRAYPKHRVIRITADHKVHLQGPSLCRVIVASYILVLIGSGPDLSFLPDDIRVGVKSDIPVDCKSNPVYVDSFSYESVRHPGLFAMGPLAGDDFVRFLQGGALAITNYLHKKSRRSALSSEMSSSQSSVLSPSQSRSPSISPCYHQDDNQNDNSDYENGDDFAIQTLFGDDHVMDLVDYICVQEDVT